MTATSNSARWTQGGGLLLLVLAAVLLGAAPTAHAATIDPDLADRPYDMGDMFLVEEDGGWFCPGTGHPEKVCPGDADDASQTVDFTSQQAAANILSYMDNHGLNERPKVLRVGKARDDCDSTGCPTGVPRPTLCASRTATPYCALLALKRENIDLGVIMGSRTVDSDGNSIGRGTVGMARQACEISQDDNAKVTADDNDSGLYDFLFIDQAHYLHSRVAEVVEMITKGKVQDNGQWVDCLEKDGTRAGGWDVVTNDNGYDETVGYTLKTLAWGHARRLKVMENQADALDAANGDKPAVTDDDKTFIRAVQSYDANHESIKTRAILRLEVTNQTANFTKWLGPEARCTLLRLWAYGQTQSPGFTLISPLYVHGAEGTDSRSYDSSHKGTFVRQMELFRKYQEADQPLFNLTSCPR